MSRAEGLGVAVVDQGVRLVRSGSGVRVLLPDGRELPGVLSVDLHTMVPGCLLKASVTLFVASIEIGAVVDESARAPHGDRSL